MLESKARLDYPDAYFIKVHDECAGRESRDMKKNQEESRDIIPICSGSRKELAVNRYYVP